MPSRRIPTYNANSLNHFLMRNNHFRPKSEYARLMPTNAALLMDLANMAVRRGTAPLALIVTSDISP